MVQLIGFWRTVKYSFNAVVLYCRANPRRCVSDHVSERALPWKGRKLCRVVPLLAEVGGQAGSCRTGRRLRRSLHLAQGISTSATCRSTVGWWSSPVLVTADLWCLCRGRFISVYTTCRTFWAVMDHNLFPLAKK